jgi:hypothetical protein
MGRLLKRIAEILKMKKALIIPVSKALQKSVGGIRKNAGMMNGRSGKLFQKAPQLMKKIIQNAPKVISRLHKRVVDNKIVGNDARNLFTVIKYTDVLVSWINSTWTARSTIQDFI